MKHSRCAVVEQDRPWQLATPLAVDPVNSSTLGARHGVAAYFSWLVVLCIGFVLGCSSNTEVPSSDVLEGKTIVYEGLPHPNFDPPGLLESEKSSKQTTVLHDCYFYKSFQPAKDTETNELRELRQLREENANLKRLVADLTLDKVTLQEVLTKNV